MKLDYEEYAKDKYVNQSHGGYSSADFVLTYINSPVLDIGCGDGYLLEKCKEKGIIAEGIELSNIATELCLNKGLCVTNTSVESFNTNKKYNSITLIDILEHVKDIKSCLINLKNLLNENGKIYVVLPNPNGLKYKLTKTPNPKQDKYHIYCPTYKEFKILTKEIGLKIINSKGIGILRLFPQISGAMFFILKKDEKK